MPKKPPGHITQRTCTFGLSPGASLDGVLEALRGRFRLRAGRPALRTRRYFDTFDWRLYEAGGVLLEETVGRQTHLRWERLADQTPVRVCAEPSAPRFARDLPPGPFREALVGVLKVRALLPVAEVRARRRVLRLLDDEDKTTARLYVETDASARDPDARTTAALGVTLRVAPVKGYDDARKALCAFLRKKLGLPPRKDHPLLRALGALGRAPGDYSSRATFDLDPAMRADEALRRMLLTLLDTIARNEPGLRANLDPEFLHDFRIAVRRTRAILGSLKAVFPEPVRARFKPEFAWLGRATGPVRDLDVYLLCLDAYEQALPPAMQEHLAPLRAFLPRRQRCEHALLVEALDTPRYQTLLRAWRALLETPTPWPAATSEAERPLREVASERIWRVYCRALEQSRAIKADPNPPTDALHRLRITCKKLRYLMEFFRSLYPPAAVGALIRALKRLQDTLGDIQDFEVQQQQLSRFALQMQDEAAAAAETLMAMGYLAAYLERRQREAGAQALKQVARFALSKTRRQFEALFAPFDEARAKA